MAVAYLNNTESHTSGTTGSVSQASFTWTHVPGGTARGVVVFVHQRVSATDAATSVTYGGVSMASLGAIVADTASEIGTVKAYFLGNSIPTGDQSVVVNRTNNTTVMYAVCYSVSALYDTTTAGYTTWAEDQTFGVQSITDTGSETNSLRLMAVYTGVNAPAAAGTGSTAGNSIDWGNLAFGTYYETTPGQGARNVGPADMADDDLAAIGLAVIEAVNIFAVPEAAVDVTAYAPTWSSPFLGTLVEPPSADVGIEAHAPTVFPLTVPTRSAELTAYAPSIWPVSIPTRNINITAYAPTSDAVTQVPTRTWRLTAKAPIWQSQPPMSRYVPCTTEDNGLGSMWISLWTVPIATDVYGRDGLPSLAYWQLRCDSQDAPTPFREIYPGNYINNDPVGRNTQGNYYSVKDTTDVFDVTYHPDESGTTIHVTQPWFSEWGSDGGDGVEPWNMGIMEHYTVTGAGVTAIRFFLKYGGTPAYPLAKDIDLGAPAAMPAYNDTTIGASSARWVAPAMFYGRDVPNGVGYLIATRVVGSNTVPVIFKWQGGQSWDAGTNILTQAQAGGTFTSQIIGWCRADQNNPDRYYACITVTQGGTTRFLVIGVLLTNIAGYTVCIDTTAGTGGWGPDTWYEEGPTVQVDEKANVEERCWPIDRIGVGKYYYFRTESSTGLKRWTRVFLNDSNWLAPTTNNQAHHGNNLDGTQGPAWYTAGPDYALLGTAQQTYMGMVWDRRRNKVFSLSAQTYRKYIAGETAPLDQVWAGLIYSFVDMDDVAGKYSDWATIVMQKDVDPDDDYVYGSKHGGIRSWGQDNLREPAPFWIGRGFYDFNGYGWVPAHAIWWWLDNEGDIYTKIPVLFDLGASINNPVVSLEINVFVQAKLGSLEITCSPAGRKSFHFQEYYDLLVPASIVNGEVVIDLADLFIYDDEDPNVLAPVTFDLSNFTIAGDIAPIQVSQFNPKYVYWGQSWVDDLIVKVNIKRATAGLNPVAHITTDRYAENQKGIDAMMIWASDMARLNVIDFENPSYTAGYDTISNRTANMNPNYLIHTLIIEDCTSGDGTIINDANFPSVNSLWPTENTGWGQAGYDALWLEDFEGPADTELYLQVGMAIGPRTGEANVRSIYFAIGLTEYTGKALEPYSGGASSTDQWLYDAGTTTNPPSGHFRLSFAGYNGPTNFAYIDYINYAGQNVSATLATWVVGDSLYFFRSSEITENAQYVISSIVNNTAQSCFEIGLTFLNQGAGAFWTAGNLINIQHTGQGGGNGVILPMNPNPVLVRKLQVESWLMGATYHDEIVFWINELRASLGLPPFLVPDTGFYASHIPDAVNQVTPFYHTDIATGHGYNCAVSAFIEHSDTAKTHWPVGWQLVSDRFGLIGAFSGAENIVFGPTYPYLDRDNPGAGFVYNHEVLNNDAPLTPYECYDAWFNSPGHYANMTYDWGDLLVYCLLGTYFHFYPTTTVMTDAYHGTTFNVIGWYQITTNNFLVVEDTVAYRMFNPSYTFEGAMIEIHNVNYSLQAYADIKTEQSLLYAIRVASDHAIPYGQKVALAHRIPTFYSLASPQSLRWHGTTPAIMDQSLVYAIDQGAKVASDHGIEYAISVQFAQTLVWEPAVHLVATHTLVYEDALQVKASHTLFYADYGKIAGEHSIQYAINASLAADHVVKYFSTVPVKSDQIVKYDIRTVNFVSAEQSILYSLAGDSSVEAPTNVTLTVRGRPIVLEDLILTQDESSPAWFARGRISTLDDFTMIQESDTASLVIGVETWAMLVVEKSFSRQFGELDMSLKLESPITRLMDPRAAKTSYRTEVDTDAETLVETILGQTVTWQIVGWTVPAGRFAVDDAAPYDAAKTLVAAAGGIIQSNPDGTLVVRYLYPNAMNTLYQSTPSHTFTDVGDNLSASSGFEYRTGMNRVRVMEGDLSFKDILDWQPEEDDDTRGLLKVFLSPWRSGYNLRYTDSDGPVVRTPRGTKHETLTELVEFTEGSGNVAKPIFSITSIVWHSDELGSVVFDQFSNGLTVGTGVNQGYGLADITYVTQYDEYYLIGNLGSKAQFLIEDEG